MTASEVAHIESLDADRIGRPESPWRALERRFTGRYPIDAFGLDPQLSDMLLPLFTFAMRVEVEGEEHVPESGPAVVVANRAFGLVEPAALAIAVKRATGRRLRVIGAPTAPFLGGAARRFGAIGATPADVTAALHAGHLVAVPLMPTWLRTGAGPPPHALMQAMTHSPIIPAAVTPVGPLSGAIKGWRVRFGDLVTLPEQYDPNDPLAAARFADAMREAVAALLAEQRTEMPEIVVADGTKIAYSAWGRRDGTPVLMIQGLGMDGRGWALQRGALGRRHRCLAPDNRGTGDSDAPPGPYDLSEMARDAIAVLDAEGIDRAHVVGASMGGVIAQIIGVMHPDRVRSLTLACTSCRHHDWRRELFAEWANAVNARGMGALSDDAMRWLIGPRLQRRFGVFVNVLARVLMQTKPSAFVAQVDAILDAREELRMELPRITAPTLVITGSQDTLTPLGDAEELAELIPGSRLFVLRGAAHGLMAEAPNVFNDVVVRFLDEVDGVARAAPAAESA